MYGSAKTLQLMDACTVEQSPQSLATELDLKSAELAKEKIKFQDQRRAYNDLLRQRSRAEELNEIITEAIQNGNLPQLNYEPPVVIDDSSCDLMVSLCDIHYGASYKNYWGEYNPDICGAEFCRYVDQILKINEIHHAEKCYVWMNGDLISGNNHYSIAVTNQENVIEQVCGVSEYVAEFLSELAHYFTEVVCVSVAGNHSRLNPNKNQTLYTERLDDLVEWYLKARLQNFDNIKIGKCDKIDETMYVVNVRGLNYLGVHGDYDGSAAKLHTLQTMAGRPLYAVMSGHLHHNELGIVDGVRTVQAGSFMGMDDYCVQKRIYSVPEQLVMVCDKNGIRCSYNVPLR